jgi:hypothetical protein
MGVASREFINLATPQAAEALACRAPRCWWGAAAGVDPQRRVVVDYKNSFEEFNQPVSTFGGHAYDGLMILVEALKRGEQHRRHAPARRDPRDHRLRRHRRRGEHERHRPQGLDLRPSDGRGPRRDWRCGN